MSKSNRFPPLKSQSELTGRVDRSVSLRDLGDLLKAMLVGALCYARPSDASGQVYNQ
jgi:hypothetical protein